MSETSDTVENDSKQSTLSEICDCAETKQLCWQQEVISETSESVGNKRPCRKQTTSQETEHLSETIDCAENNRGGYDGNKRLWGKQEIMSETIDSVGKKATMSETSDCV